MDKRVGLDRQVWAAAYLWGEITQRRTPADAIDVVMGQRADTGRIRCIMIGAIGKTSRTSGRIKGGMVGAPLCRLKTPGWDRTVVAMIGCLIIEIALVTTKGREQLGIAPAVIAGRGPTIVILRYTTEKDHRIDRA